MIEIPTTLTVEQFDVIWLKIEGPIEVMTKLSAWMLENHCNPVYKCGGSGGPWFINFAFTPDNAKRLRAKLTQLEAKLI